MQRGEREGRQKMKRMRKKKEAKGGRAKRS